MPRHIARHVAITIDVIITSDGNRRANRDGSPFAIVSAWLEPLRLHAISKASRHRDGPDALQFAAIIRKESVSWPPRHRPSNARGEIVRE